MFRLLIAPLSALVLLAVPYQLSAAEPALKAGAYAINVSPEHFPISVNGLFSDRMAEKVNDPLHARCLVLDDGITKLALVIVDSCMIPRELMDDAKRMVEKSTGIPAGNITISATHTHSAPTVTGVFQSDPDEKYVAYLAKKIAEGIEKAHSNLTEAEVGWAVVQEPSQLFNRRWRMKPNTVLPDPFGGSSDLVKMNPGYQNPNLLKPAGPIDPDVSILAVRAKGTKRPLALFANYSLHYVGDLPMLSADYFGVFSEQIGSLIGADDQEPKFVGALSNGTSGDVNNVNYAGEPVARTGPGERCRLVAGVVAEAAKKAWDKAEFRSDITLNAAGKDLQLKVRKPEAEELARAKKILDAAGDRVLKGAEEVYARETVLIDKYPDTVPVRVQVFRIGDLGIAAIPCETFTNIGLQLKKESPLKPTFTISLANGYNGYLPTPEQHELGGYETWRARSSYLETEASVKITDALLELFKEVAEK